MPGPEQMRYAYEPRLHALMSSETILRELAAEEEFSGDGTCRRGREQLARMGRPLKGG